ncbi:squamosa promoter-binding-like protein 1 [Magnolia sinica]|uniref:squamosa promoter-binding-like protein 1 n=1 Tax=Magnolia sinica TaxID=86752 RepID=UPI002657EA06|nr:squamosa promoter-binding-like protein 1 [Magnolia sinica]
MEARIGSGSRHFYGQDSPDFVMKERNLMGIGKRSTEWNMDDWKWDGDLFIASPLNSVPLDCRSKQFIPLGLGNPAGGILSNSSSSCSDEVNAEEGKGKGELEKRRRVVVVEEDEPHEEAGPLTLKLGGHVYPIMESDFLNWEEKNGKKTQVQGPSSSRSVCQVEGCGADLSNARDYHRRHKVCEMHSKATNALVGNVMQRFCQQCSRFHILQEFDEGKRSCRRRLAGHNRRRRKTHPDAVVGGNSLNDDRASSYLLITLLRILSNLHSHSSDGPNDQDFLSHLLKNLANFAGASDGRNLSGILQLSQDLKNNGIPVGASSVLPAFLPNDASVAAEESLRPSCLTSNGTRGADTQHHLARPQDQSLSVTVAAGGLPQKGITIGNSLGGIMEAIPSTKPTNVLPIKDGLPSTAEVSCSFQRMLPPEYTFERAKSTNIDLNSIYIDSQECPEGLERTQAPANLGTGSLDYPSWLLQDSHQSSPPQTSGNSDSTSAQSPTSSNGDAQSRTDRIVFKLFGKDPNDIPLVLRSQILDWLSHSPTDIESYIKPGCIILTIYVRLAESTWEDLCCDLRCSLQRLLDVYDNDFWRTGWVYARIQHQMAFIYNGQVVLDTSLPLTGSHHCRIASVMPIAVSASERANFTVKGFNICRSAMRLLCAIEGKYLVLEMSDVSVEGTETPKEHDELQCLSFSCSLPNVSGRGFVEVEDDGLSSGFFPFIVAERDLCLEIRTLESAIEASECDAAAHKRTDVMKARNQALDFLHDMGWLLRRSHLRSRLDHKNAHSGSFPLKQFKWLMEFSMDHDWCAVVKKLLDVLFDGPVDAGGHSSVEMPLLEMGLLHRAVRRNCRPMVELLLRYVSVKTGRQHDQGVGEGSDGGFLFRPDMVGPAGVTPLHIAASRDDTENVLDALTDDPGLVGIEAWRNARDNSGFAPEDYARLRGYYSYIHLIQKKINKKSEARHGHMVLDIPGSSQKQTTHLDFTKPTAFQIEKRDRGPVRSYCKACDQRLVYGNISQALPYRPLMLSMVTIAAVCVCVGLLFHGPPEVQNVSPFIWELLHFGPI